MFIHSLTSASDFANCPNHVADNHIHTASIRLGTDHAGRTNQCIPCDAWSSQNNDPELSVLPVGFGTRTKVSSHVCSAVGLHLSALDVCFPSVMLSARNGPHALFQVSVSSGRASCEHFSLVTRYDDSTVIISIRNPLRDRCIQTPEQTPAGKRNSNLRTGVRAVT